jgi:hypothetical protein
MIERAAPSDRALSVVEPNRVAKQRAAAILLMAIWSV